MLSLANNDLNLTLVMDADQAPRIAKKLHALLVENHPQSYFHQSWQAEFGEQSKPQQLWWQDKREQLLQLNEKCSPLYVYDEASIKNAIANLKTIQSVDQFFYAMKANSHHDILRLVYQSGLGFECVSINEVNLILTLFPNIDRKKILFTPNFAPRQEYQQGLQLGINVTIDNIHPIMHWPEIFSQQEVFVRIDPGQGAGHHKYVNTAGSESKFGIPLDDIDTLKSLSKRHQINIVGLHAHSGSGILKPGIWRDTADAFNSLIKRFP